MKIKNETIENIINPNVPKIRKEYNFQNLKILNQLSNPITIKVAPGIAMMARDFKTLF